MHTYRQRGATLAVLSFLVNIQISSPHFCRSVLKSFNLHRFQPVETMHDQSASFEVKEQEAATNL